MTNGAEGTAPGKYTIADLPQLVLEADARIRPYVVETSLEPIPVLAPESGTTVLFKLENLQHTGSFKLRGATNKILLLTAKQAADGVIAASTGNHGLGVVAAARSRGVPAEVYVSSQISPSKAKHIEKCGARVRVVGKDPLDAELAAREAANKSGRVFISPYNDWEVIAGQGTIAAELHRQAPQLDAVFVAVGGGGLISGIGSYLKSVSPRTEIVGCWPENSRVLYESIQAGRILDFPEQPTLSESTAGGLEPESVTLNIARKVIDRSVLVSEEEILAAMRRVQSLMGRGIEGAAGVALAAFLKDPSRYRGKSVAIVICGGNVSPEVLRQLQ
jgi:threonine dehydratase